MVPQPQRREDEPMTVDQCKNYMTQKIIPNSRYQFIEKDTAGDIDQFNASRVRGDLKPKPEPSYNTNLFENESVLNKIWFKNKNLDSRAVANTFKYIFYKFKKGIFIRIADNKLQTFLPFENANYKNEFGHILKVDPKYGSVQDFLDHVSKLLGYRSNRQSIKPFDEWVANNSLVRYEVDKETSVANNKVTLLNMFRTLCKERDVPDIEFFINRRDYPQMKVDNTEPYNHIWGTKQQPLVSHKYDKYAPILSGSSAEEYADIPFPTYEDWARAIYQETGLVFPSACREYPVIQLTPWVKKIEKAVFRGATTGSGVTADTNQRLRALEMGTKHKELLDVGITKWNLRPRKLEGSAYLQTIERGKGNYNKANRLNLQEQSLYKYILTLEGHVAAYRLSYELSSGSVVLLARSQWQMWYYPFLKEYIHYVPVKEDLSNLLSQIEWCKGNDAKCEQIAKNARAFYNKYLGTKGILDFLQKELWELSKKTKPYKYLPDLTIWTVEDEERQLLDELKKGSRKFADIKYDYQFSSPRCVGTLDAMLKVMRSKSINDLTWKETIFKNVNGTIDRFTTNGFNVVGKKANNRGKELEHIHENYIGLKAVNKLVARTPNFAYVFGPLKDAQDMVFVEHIEGMSLMHWLKSPQYEFKNLLSILVQLNLALSVAQNYGGFIHYDLYPWNVMVQSSNNVRYYTGSKDGQQAFTYFLNFQTTPDLSSPRKQNVVTLKQPVVVPVMIDYGKSRAIVYEPKYGTIDHGFANLYQQNSIVDSLTILYGSLNVLKDIKRLDSNELKLLDFPKRLGLESHEDTKRWGKFGALFDFKPKTKTGSNAVPKNFVDFVMTTFRSSAPKLLQASEFVYPMEKGVNPVIAEGFMRHGDKNEALLEMIKHVDRSRPPVSDDMFFQLVIRNMLQRRLGWVEDEMAKGSNDIKKKWAIVRKLLTQKRRVESAMPEMDFPKPTAIYLDDEVTPEYIERYAEVARSTMSLTATAHEDWMKTWVLCLEAYLFGVVKDEGDYGEFIGLDGFLYHSALASNNTLVKLREMLLMGSPEGS